MCFRRSLITWNSNTKTQISRNQEFYLGFTCKSKNTTGYCEYDPIPTKVINRYKGTGFPYQTFPKSLLWNKKMSYRVKMKNHIFDIVLIKNLPQTQSLQRPVYQWLEVIEKVFFCIKCFSWCWNKKKSPLITRKSKSSMVRYMHVTWPYLNGSQELLRELQNKICSRSW